MTQGLRIGIAGLGLIGGALAQALAVHRPDSRRMAFDPVAAPMEAALRGGAIQSTAPSLTALLEACDVVVLCQPVGALVRDLANLSQAARLPVLCDVASVKGAVLQAAAHLGPRRGRFVGAHPIAGKAESGWAAAEPGLFRGRRVVLCEEGSDDDARALVRSIWTSVGAVPVAMDAVRHDRIYAAVSHLPQLLTWAYLDGVSCWPGGAEAPAFGGTGFAGFTRLAHSSPALWAGIAIHNREPLVSALDAVAGRLQVMRDALERADANALQALFDNARAMVERAPLPEGTEP
jgi:prephenate dehydrogenase